VLPPATQLQVEDCLDEYYIIKARFWKEEQKGGKRQECVANASILGTLEEYVGYLINLSIMVRICSR
jgi:hypothetical protein